MDLSEWLPCTGFPFLPAAKVKFKKRGRFLCEMGTVFISTITQVGVLPVSPVSNRTNRQ